MTRCLDDLLEAWEVHNEINLFILRWIPPEGLEAVTYGIWGYWGGYSLKEPAT